VNIEEYRNYCITKAGVTEEFPFDEQTLVFKVMGKMFALTDVDAFESINLKCDPVKAIKLRELHVEVKPGYHMNKKHWNTVYIRGQLEDRQIYQWTDDSYDLVVQKLPKYKQRQLQKT